MLFRSQWLHHRRVLVVLRATLLCAVTAISAWSQGPTPETGATLFPSGAFVSYNSVFVNRQAPNGGSTSGLSPTARPTFQHIAPLTFAWGIRRDWQITAVVPIVTTRFDPPSSTSAAGLGHPGGTGLGDALVFVKYRFLRLDSARGTTQASISAGPKLPTGRTSLRDSAGVRLPAGLQPGSGSTDFFVNLSGTYTGLFNVKRLVADETVSYLLRTEGSQQMRLGSGLASRFWLSYRPYESKNVDKEWWIGPALTIRHDADDRLAGINQPGSGGNVVLLGAATYFSPRAGMELWFGADFPVTQTVNTARARTKRLFSFGITQQFQLHRK